MKRRWLLWILVIAFFIVVITRFSELEKLAQTLVQGKWPWVLAAAALQIGYYLAFAELFHASFHTVGVRAPLRDLLPVMLGSLFVDVVAPSGGAASHALFIDDAARRGESPARAAGGVLLARVADFVTFGMVLLAGLIYLLIRHDLQIYEIVGAAILLLIILGMSGVLGLGLWRPAWLSRLLRWTQRLANGIAIRFKRSPLLDDAWVETNASEFRSAAMAIATHPGRLTRTLSVGLAAQILDVASLYALGMAFYGRLSIAVVVAAYGIGVLFWIVSITPGGIGVVEGVMPLVFISLGVPGSAATVITLAFRGLSFWLPLLLGFLALRRIRSFGARERAVGEAWGVRLVAIVTGAMGILNVISAVTPGVAVRLALLEQALPLQVQQGGQLTAALGGFALLLLATNLWRRKRVAWWLTLAVLSITVISHLVKGLDYEEAIIAAGLAIWLVALRYEFHASSDVPSIRQGAQVLVGAVMFTLAYGIVGFYLLDRHFGINFGLGEAARQTVIMFTEFYDPGLEPITGFGRYFADSIYAVGAFTVGYALLALMRPVFLRRPATPEQRMRARTIVEAYGRSSLARCTLFDDKSYYFTPGGSVIAFVAKGRVAIALGDPIGPENDFPSAIAGFKMLCARNDWRPVFYQTLPDHLADYRTAGMDVLAIGQEAIVDLSTFTMEGKGGKDLRRAARQLTEAGHRTEYLAPPISDSVMDELRIVSDEWLTMMHGKEKRFSLGWFDDDYIRNSPVMVVRTPEGLISAFANLVPEYQRNEITIDLMRRRADIAEGTMMFLFVSLFQWAKSQGYASFNLGLSSFAGVGERSDDPTVERALHYIYEHVNQFYNFQGLHTFKSHFHPRWEPRFLIYPSAADLPAIALALVRADSGDEFLRDYLGEIFRRRKKG